MQHDVQELNRILFNAIGEALMSTSQAKLIDTIYQGTFVNMIICQNCKRVSRRTEDFLDLTLPLTGLKNLNERSIFAEKTPLTAN